MTLPTFVGLGAPRCGSTWLHELLASHPQVYVPTRRKEVRFFTDYYDRGLQWYERFFPSDEQAAKYRAIGEVTPDYLFCTDCPERIASIGSVDRLLLIVRNPVDRAFSHYGIEVRYRGFRGSFEDFIAQVPSGIHEGFYGQAVKNYLRHFNRDQLLVLIFELATTDVSQTRETLAHFLGVAGDEFPRDAGTRKVHQTYVPTRARSIYDMSGAIARRLRDWDQDWVRRLARRLRVRRLFGESASLPPMAEETRQYLIGLYADQIDEFESILQIDLEDWRQAWVQTPVQIAES